MHLILQSSCCGTQATLKAIQKQTGLKELSLRDVPMDSFQVGGYSFAAAAAATYICYMHTARFADTSYTPRVTKHCHALLLKSSSMCVPIASPHLSSETLALTRCSISVTHLKLVHNTCKHSGAVPPLPSATVGRGVDGIDAMVTW
jgi:hypothetical protein